MPNHNLKPAQKIHGWTVKKIKNVPGIEAEAIVLTHNKTNAQYLHLASDDPENVFGVSFKTIPQDDTGAAHILEHTVLTGSKKYPVRDPFFSMLKRSLSSFMNAFTANDWTMYPFATVNKKDFYNLLDVYLNAVFFPTLSRLNFMQEGHRLEIGQGGKLVRQGVVYNEMKGAMSSPVHIEASAINRSLFTNNYKYNSGGDPDAIPKLTHKQLINFHQRFYHPSNSFFYSYGNLPLAGHLRRVNDAIKDFGEIDPRTEINLEAKRQKPAYTAFNYAVNENEKIDKKYQAIMAWITAPVENRYEIIILEVLSNVLLDNSASPLKKALIDSGLGSALTEQIGLEGGEYREAVFSCGLKDILEKDVKKVEKIILSTLSGLADKGIDPQLVESAIHQLEFEEKELSEQGLPRGLALLLKISESWFHGRGPLPALLFNKQIARLRKDLKNKVLEKAIGKYFLNNNNRALIKLVPDPEKPARDEKQRQEELKQLKSGLSQADLEKIKKDAVALQRLQSGEEDLSCLPGLEIADISPAIITAKEAGTAAKNITAYEQPANGIIYLKSFFSALELSPELIDFVPIFCYALPRVGTRTKSHEEMARQISLKTGGLDLAGLSHNFYGQPDKYFASVNLEAKCLDRNIDAMIDILSELALEPDFSDTKRLKAILEEMRSNFEASLLAGGNAYALLLASRGLSAQAAINEKWNGIHSLLAVKKILSGGQEALKNLSLRLPEIGQAIFKNNNQKTAVISDKNLIKNAAKKADAWLSSLPSDDNNFIAECESKTKLYSEGWSTVGDASYCAKTCRTVLYSDPLAPAMQIAAKLIGRNYLHREIREKGGAYGGGAAYNTLSGTFSLMSYRDPHIKRTLDIFDQAVDWILAGKFSDQDVKEAILQICAEIDKPESPEQKAARAFFRKIIGLSAQDRRYFKDNLLKTQKKDVIKAARRLCLDWQKSSAAVISYGEKLKKEGKNMGLDIRKI